MVRIFTAFIYVSSYTGACGTFLGGKSQRMSLCIMRGIYVLAFLQVIDIWRRLTLPAPCISKSCAGIKNCLSFLFSLGCFKRFYEGLKGLHKTFWGTSKKFENRNSSNFHNSSGIGTGMVNLPFTTHFDWCETYGKIINFTGSSKAAVICQELVGKRSPWCLFVCFFGVLFSLFSLLVCFLMSL